MRALAIALALVSTACSEPRAPERSGPQVTPETISYADIEANGLHGPGCAFALGGSIAPILMAFPDHAVMKLGGEIRRFRIDPESERGTVGGNTRYFAQDRVLSLAMLDGQDIAGQGNARGRGSLRLTDEAGAALFAAEGSVQCSSSRSPD